MKRLNLAIATGLLIALFPAQAQGADISTSVVKTVSATLQADIADDANRSVKMDKPEEPTRPDATGLDPGVKQIVTCFEQARDAFVAQQKDLKAQLRGAPDDQRDRIREELKQTQDQFAAQREQFRDQLKEAQDKLRQQQRKLKDEVAPAKGTGKPRT